MAATAVSKARTRSYARVLGPYFVIATGIIFVRAPSMIPLLTSFFASPALVFIAAALMLFAGICVIANHQYWSSPAAAVISVFGWFLVLRALALMFFPMHYEAIGLGPNGILIGRGVFGVIFTIGLWLSWTGWTAKPPEAT